MRRRFMNTNSVADINYMGIEALEDEFSVRFTNLIYYKIDDGEWSLLLSGESTPFINQGSIIYFKGELLPNISTGIGSFTIKQECNLVGNCMSLIYGDKIKNPYLPMKAASFTRLFENCSKIINIEDTFLPATTLADNCYKVMFYGCTSLVNAPELPATTLANYCYDYMFYGCTNLNYIKMLATDISATDCLLSWVYGVSSTGTFVKNKDATWDVRDESGIPSNWKIEYDHNYDIGSDISFHIERIDETLYAKDWMTWDDWVHSKYNTVSACILNYEIIIYSYSTYPLNINLDNIIKNGGTYYFRYFGGGSD